MFDDHVFTDRLRKLILTRMTYKACSEQTGLNPNTIYLWKARNYVPSITTVMLILELIEPTDEEILWLFGKEMRCMMQTR